VFPSAYPRGGEQLKHPLRWNPVGCYFPPSFPNVNCENPHGTGYFVFLPSKVRSTLGIQVVENKKRATLPVLQPHEKSGFRPKKSMRGSGAGARFHRLDAGYHDFFGRRYCGTFAQDRLASRIRTGPITQRCHRPGELFLLG